MKEISWFVAYTYPRTEKLVHKLVQDSGFNSYLPLLEEKRKWSDRIKKVKVPLFPSYVFIQTLEEYIPQLLAISYISKFVSFDRRYAKVKDKEIGQIKQLLDKGKIISSPSNQFRKGQRVRVKEGPFLGMEGILLNEGGKSRFVLRIDALKQNLSVNIPAHYLESV